MKSTTIAGAQRLERPAQANPAEARDERPDEAIRALRDWELLLVGGGQDDPGFE